MLPSHVVEGDGVEYVCVANDGAGGGREVVGILLDDCGVVVKGECDTYVEGEKSSSEASYAAESIDGGDLWRQWWSRANGDPDIGAGDVKEAKACGVEVEEEIKGQGRGRRG